MFEPSFWRYGGFNNTFSIFSVIFFIMFGLIFTIIVITIVKGLKQWNKNNHSPLLSVEAKVVAKRNEVSHSHHHNSDNAAMSHTSTSTYYYVTFEFESKDRLELQVSGKEYGMLVEGDFGKLRFQGTRYKGFQRY